MGNDETELIARILGGTSDDFRILVDRHKDQVYRHCFYIIHDEDIAEDMAQDAFIRAYTKLKMFDARKGSYKTWQLTIATRICLEHLRRERALPLEGQETLASTLTSPHGDAEAGELHEAVRKLKPKHRTAISMYYWQGYSYEDIATYMDAPIGSVRAWIHRAKKELKEVLS
jgi:RNA polymerase sigma-70 factor (ECF subfamily)